MNDHARHIAAGALAAALSLACAGAAWSDVIAPQCLWDSQAARIVPFDADSYPQGALPVIVQDVGGFALNIVENIQDANRGVEWFILQHCDTGQEIAIRLPGGDTRSAEEDFERMVFGPDPFTLRQIGERMSSEFDAQVRISRTTLGSCACNHLGLG